MRETGYSLEQISKLLELPKGRIQIPKRSVLLNDLGIMAFLDGEIPPEKKIIEIFLSAGDSKEDRFISFYWLGKLYDRFDVENIGKILREFVNNPKNSSVVKEFATREETSDFVSQFTV